MSGIRTIYKNMPAWVVFLLILTFGSIIFAAGVAINSQTKTTTVASGDVFPSYNAAAGAGRGITAANLANGLAALITEGSLANSIVVSDDIKDATIALGDIADGDWGDFTKSTTFTLDADVVAAAEMADADHGDVSWSSGVATVDANAVLIDEIGDAGASASIAFDAAEGMTFTSPDDQWVGVTISNSEATITAETKLLTLDMSAATNDTNLTFFEIQDSGGAIFDFKGGATRAQMTGDFDIVISAMDLGDNDITSLDKLEFYDTAIYIDGGTDGYLDLEADTAIRLLGPVTTAETFTSTAAIVGELSEIDEGAVSGDALTAPQLRGTLLTNEGDADGETWELPAAESGLHFKVICAETQDIVLDAGASDGIYVSDDDAISAPSGDDNNVTMDCANVGESMTCVTFSQDGSSWDWLCECGAGSCTEGA